MCPNITDMALIKKKTQQNKPTTLKKQVIKVNPYENPENVMELMANICSATPSVDTDVYWQTIREAYNKNVRGKSLKDYLQDNRGNLLNNDFYHELEDYCRQLSWGLTSRENTEHTQIVVAGGFSSGKSSFLNRLTNSTNLLPTGTDPVSVVKTYLYCSRNTSSISVRGVNQKNVLVNLDTGVLQAIQHASKSNIYLASVLDKLFVEIPSNELDGLVFIDTPGYNNSDKQNKSNGKTDKDTALEALSEGNVLFWFVGADRPTITVDDMEIIRQFNGRKVFVFNKADKVGSAESKKIVEDGAKIIFKEFEKKDIIDIIAYSSSENKVYYSLNNMSLSAIVKEAKKSGNGSSELEWLQMCIEDLFDSEISASQNTINNLQDEYSECIDEKNTRNKNYHDIKYNDDEYITSEVRRVLVDGYNDIMEAAENITEASQFALHSFLKFYNGVLNFENNDHWGSSSILDNAINQADRAYDNALDKHNAATEYSFWKEDYRVELANRVQNYIADRFKDVLDDISDKCEDLLEDLNAERALIKDMQEYKQVFMTALNRGIRSYKNLNKATTVSSSVQNEIPNVFDCIKKDNYKLFLRSFEKGVDLAVCNADGYSPLTLAVQMGNNMMVQFMLDHDADPNLQDRRGYNAFHTAVENQYRDICKLLLDVDPDLIETKTAKGESIETLAKKQTFTKWIENEIDNAF